ncbi:hypothetical protein Fcan01_08960 [Folsomia candida]|uniref:Uncharacterized protein n=1 Tax=Folsomia candida TaxID=158441 RepID=A0A226EE56_FOLCA|nr:hypothetical protein Fcan01_08960 [Folsomia candida]
MKPVYKDFMFSGCQRFGHSCFGAHGKRGGDVGATGGQQNGAELSPGESVYPAGPGAEYYPAGGFAPRVGMSPYLMDWLLSAHRGQPLSANYARQLQDDLNMADQRRK